MYEGKEIQYFKRQRKQCPQGKPVLSWSKKGNENIQQEFEEKGDFAYKNPWVSEPCVEFQTLRSPKRLDQNRQYPQ